MKSFLILFVAIIALMDPLKGAAADSEGIITVTGTGEITAPPDLAIVKIGTTTEMLSAKRCYSENNEIMRKVREALLQLGIKKDDIKTTRFDLSPRYEYPGGGVRKFAGYRMVHIYTVKIRDLDILGDALDAATQAGADEISSITFTIENPDELEAQARAKAVKAAEAKAATIAKAAGVTVTKVHSIVEGATRLPQPLTKYREMEASPVSAPLEPGTQKISVTVTIHYEFE